MQSPSIYPNRERLAAFIAGKTPVGSGRFWMVNMLRFKHGGAERYRQYTEAVMPIMEAIGGKAVFALYSGVRTVVDGGGLVPEWDGVFIGEYPSPAAFEKLYTNDAYRAAHKHRVAALEYTEMYACDADWVGKVSRSTTPANTQQKQPDFGIEMKEARRLAGNKSKQQLEAINGRSKTMMGWMRDKQFNSGRVWMLNLLQYEGCGRAKYYHEYGIRAQSFISSTSTGSNTQ
eukprot:Hpha_TRINITY_DN16808_c1_g1::TRINITY_DN16808_c1_g1_i10::g.149098::m.149098